MRTPPQSQFLIGGYSSWEVVVSNASSLHSADKPHFVVADDKKAGVEEYEVQHKYTAGDVVYLLCIGGQQQGPYKIEAAEKGMYTLCDLKGATVNGGTTYKEDDLKLYNPFA